MVCVPGLLREVWFVYRAFAGGTPRRCVPFQFEYVSTTVLPLSIMELTNSFCTESAAGDTPRHSVDFSFSASLRYETD